MSGNTKAYYEFRAEKERALAAAAVSPKIAAIHLEMAERYDLLAGGATNDNDRRPAASTTNTAEL